MSMGAVAATLLAALLALHWALASGIADDGCSGFRHLENGRTFFRYGGLYVTFSCNPGFRIHGYRTSSCVSGQWAREPPLCVAPGCPSPGDILHGSREVSPDSSVVRFTCNSGFRLFGSPLLYCKGKRWNGTIPVCKESDIMSLFQLKQTSLYESSVELNLDTLPSLKSRFNTIAHTASKEAFRKPSLLGLPQPKLFEFGDVLKDPRKPPEKKPAKKLWSDKATTQGKGRTVGLKETVNRLDIVEKPVLKVDPLIQPLPAATFLNTTTTTVPKRSPTPAPLLSRPIGSTILVSPAKNNHEAHMSLRNPGQMLSSSPNGEDGREHHFMSETHRDNNNPVTPLPGKVVAEADISHSTKVTTGSPHKQTLGITGSTSSPEVKESELSYSTRKPLQTSLQEEDTVLHVTVTEKGSSVLFPTSSTDLPVSETETLSLRTSSKPFMVTSSPVIPTAIHDGELPLHKSLATWANKDLLPGTNVLTAATQPAPALHLTESPDVTTKKPYLEHPAESNTHREQTGVDKDSAESIDSHGMVDGQEDREFNDVSRSPGKRPLSVQALQTPSTLKNRTSVTNNHGQENATNNQSVVKETLDLATKPNLTVATAEIPGFLTGKRRPTCPYPPLPAHGTFYFRTIVNPAPFQYKHYVQYACYPGYTLANGDVYSYCLQDKQWSGVTPMCIEETPCSLNNGGCSQMCQVNEQNRAECHCKAGFLLLEDQRTCRDLDECVEDLHQCQQVYENTFGSYRCSCSAGFQLSADRMSCTDVNECALPAGIARCVFGCVNTPGSFHCHCPAGYRVNMTDGHCTDIDECMENGGHGPCVSTCVNNPGSFHCACPHGYQVAGDGKACISECPPGYRKRRSASAVGNFTTEPCIDIDECEEMAQRQIQQHRCEWKCVNLPGSHLCVCPRGYAQHPDGYHCKDINECSLKNGGCSHICLNQRGSFRCTCPEDYRISPYNRRKCQPIHNSQRSVS